MYNWLYSYLFYIQLNLKYDSNAASINSPSIVGEVTVVPTTLSILIRIGLLAVLFESHNVQLVRRCSMRTPCWFITQNNSVISELASVICWDSGTAKDFYFLF